MRIIFSSVFCSFNFKDHFSGQSLNLCSFPPPLPISGPKYTAVIMFFFTTIFGLPECLFPHRVLGQQSRAISCV